MCEELDEARCVEGDARGGGGPMRFMFSCMHACMRACAHAAIKDGQASGLFSDVWQQKQINFILLTLTIVTSKCQHMHCKRLLGLAAS